MADLATEAVDPGDDLAVEDEAATDSCAQDQAEDGGTFTACTLHRFGERGAVGVVSAKGISRAKSCSRSWRKGLPVSAGMFANTDASADGASPSTQRAPSFVQAARR